MSASNTLENTLLKVLFTANSYTGGNVYASLYSVAPTESSAGTEITGNGYSRQQVAWSVTDNIAESTGNVTFSATGNAWTAVAIGLVDANTAGNLMFYKTLPSTQVNAGESITFPTGDITITCD